jgi:hypothetical protein
MSEVNKVLVACPVWHGDRCNMEAFRKQYEGYDILLVDNTLDNGQFSEYLKSIGFGNVIRHRWNPDETYLMNMLADCDEEIRKYLLEHKEYSHWFWTAPDIKTPENAIGKLLVHNKDIVGFPCNMYGPQGPPAVFVDGTMYWMSAGRFTLNIYTWEQLNARHGLFRVHGIGGACLYHRKVLESCAFQYPQDILWGEDLWWYAACADKGFEVWCDSSDRAYNHTGVNPSAMFECRLNLFRFLTKWVRKHPDSFYNKFLE